MQRKGIVWPLRSNVNGNNIEVSSGNFKTGYSVNVNHDIVMVTNPDTCKLSCSYLFHYISEDRIIYLCITDNVRY